jgi:hypothetical protein
MKIDNSDGLLFQMPSSRCRSGSVVGGAYEQTSQHHCCTRLQHGYAGRASTIDVTYNFFSAGLTGPPIMSGATLIVDGLFTGSVLSGDPV